MQLESPNSAEPAVTIPKEIKASVLLNLLSLSDKKINNPKGHFFQHWGFEQKIKGVLNFGI